MAQILVRSYEGFWVLNLDPQHSTCNLPNATTDRWGRSHTIPGSNSDDGLAVAFGHGLWTFLGAAVRDRGRFSSVRRAADDWAVDGACIDPLYDCALLSDALAAVSWCS